MAEDTQDQEKDQDTGTQEGQDQEKDQDQDFGTQEDQDQEKDQKDSGKKEDPAVKRAIQRRDSALKRAQKAEERARELEEKYEGKKEDPVAKANRRLVSAEARVVMTGKGITDAGDQRELVSFLGLDDVEVAEDGTVDSDAIQERLESLVRILGKMAGTGKRTPRVDTRDRAGEKASPKDAQTQRRRQMLGLG